MNEIIFIWTLVSTLAGLFVLDVNEPPHDVILDWWCTRNILGKILIVAFVIFCIVGIIVSYLIYGASVFACFVDEITRKKRR